MIDQTTLAADILLHKDLLDLSKMLRIGAYDVNVNPFPKNIEYTENLPVVLIFPAFKKGPPYRKFTGKLDALNVIKFVI